MKIQYLYSIGKDTVFNGEIPDAKAARKHLLDLETRKSHMTILEVLEGCGDHFAVINAATAEKILEVVMADNCDLPLKEKLNQIEIKWNT